MKENYSELLTCRITPSMREELHSIGGDTSAFVRGCLRSGIAYYKSTIEKVNSEEKPAASQFQPETVPSHG